MFAHLLKNLFDEQIAQTGRAFASIFIYAFKRVRTTLWESPYFITANSKWDEQVSYATACEAGGLDIYRKVLMFHQKERIIIL